MTQSKSNETIQLALQEKVYFFSGCMNPERFPECTGVIKALLRGYHKSAHLDLKKMKYDRRVYTARLNDKDRMLFTVIENKILVLDVIRFHDYQKSFYFRRKTTAKAFDKSVQKVLNAVTSSSLDVLAEEPIEENELNDIIQQPELQSSSEASSDDASSIDWRPMYATDDKFIVLSETQEHSAQRGFPASISGLSGAGKTVVGECTINRLIPTLPAGEKILYVTETPKLAEKMYTNLSSAPESEFAQDKVYCLSYNALFEQHKRPPEGQTLKYLDVVAFREWFDIFVVTKNNKTTEALRKETSIWDKLKADPDKIYKEYRILSGLTETDYLKLTREHRWCSLLTSEAERKAVFDSFMQYSAELRKRGATYAYDPALTPLNVSGKYYAIFVDEAQLFSSLQLKNLRDMSKKLPPNERYDQQMRALKHGDRICYLLDVNQDRREGSSKREIIESLFFNEDLEEKTELKLSALTATHRCPAAVSRFANGILSIRDVFRQGKSIDQKQERRLTTSATITEQGKVIWMNEPDSALRKLINTPDLDGEVAVITHPGLIEKAKKELTTDMVFTFDEISGLEYRHVILYQPFSRDFVKNIDKRLMPSAAESADDQMYILALQETFTASTRSFESLTIIQPSDTKKESLFLNRLKSAISPVAVAQTASNSPIALLPVTASTSSSTPDVPENHAKAAQRRERLLKEVKKLLDNGSNTQALALFKKAGYTRADFERVSETYRETIAQGMEESIAQLGTQVESQAVVLRTKQLFSHLKQIFEGDVTENLKQLFRCEDVIHFMFKTIKEKFTLAQPTSFIQYLCVYVSMEHRALFLDQLLRTLRKADEQSVAFKQKYIAARDAHQCTLLHYLAGCENHVPPDALAELGEINAQNLDGNTALYLSMMYKRDEMFQAFLDAGAALDMVNKKDFTPLFLAIINDYMDYARKLVNKGANIHRVAENSSTALSLLLVRKLTKAHIALIFQLLDAGIDTNTNVIFPVESPLYFATLGHDIPVAKRIVRKLFEKGARLDQCSRNPLIHGFLHVKIDSEFLDIFLENGANLNTLIDIQTDISKDVRGKLLQPLACLANQKSVYIPIWGILLFEASRTSEEFALVRKICALPGINLDLCDENDGHTPVLIAASAHSSRTMLDILIQAGADLHRPTKKSPVLAALVNDSYHNVRFLLDQGLTCTKEQIEAQHFPVDKTLELLERIKHCDQQTLAFAYNIREKESLEQYRAYAMGRLFIPNRTYSGDPGLQNLLNLMAEVKDYHIAAMKIPQANNSTETSWWSDMRSTLSQWF